MFNCGPSNVSRRVPVQPLFPEHCKEGGEERGGETHEEDHLDLDNRVGRARPLWYRGRVISEGGVVDFVYKDAKKGSSLVVRVGLEVGVNFDNECGGYCGEQTSLLPVLAYVHQTSQETHEDQGRVQIFIVLLYELLVILLGLSAVVLKELGPVVLLSGRYVLSSVE